MSNEGAEGRVFLSSLPAALFGGIALLMVGDIVEDAVAGAELTHLVVELTGMALALVGAVFFFRQWRQERRAMADQIRKAHADAARWREESERWRREAHEALQGLGVAIDHQFERWGLTSAEREVGLLILKGLSHKEIASVRGTSERTVRQQALTLYQKAGLAGRAELAAFFLEDLLLPVDSKAAAG